MPDNVVSLSAARAADLPDLLSLYRDMIPDDPPLSLDAAATRLDALLRLPSSTVLIARAAEQAVATATLIVVPNLTRGGRPYAFIENVVTATRARRRGYGRAVLAEAVERAWAVDCYKIMLLADSDNHGALAFYRAVGFEAKKTGLMLRRDL